MLRVFFFLGNESYINLSQITKYQFNKTTKESKIKSKSKIGGKELRRLKQIASDRVFLAFTLNSRSQNYKKYMTV